MLAVVAGRAVAGVRVVAVVAGAVTAVDAQAVVLVLCQSVTK